MWLFPIRNSLTRRLPYSVLLQCTKQNKPQNLILVPKQNFGQGQKQRIFGHAKVKSASKYPDFGAFIIFAPLTLLILFNVPYSKLKDRFGIDFGVFRRFLNRDHGAGTDYTRAKDIQVERRKDPGLEYAMQENLEEIQEYMKQEALKRYQEELKELANSDPEFKVILAGDPEEMAKLEITDKETFEAKKLWASQFQNSIKAETPFAMVEDPDEDAIEVSSGSSNENYGFKHRKIVDYENRLRQYSTPDKIFRYFATYQVIDKKGQLHIMMTPDDFLRSITPGMKQPEKMGLDKYVTLNNQNELSQLVTSLGMDEDSIFHQLSSGGLISFSDYIFLLTVLSTSRRHFEIAFKMFDLNGDGNVDAKEFEVVTNLMKNQSSMGARHRDHSNTGNAYKGINSGLISFFFGPNREGILTVEKFLEFQRQLQNEILRLEFTRKSSGSNNTISEKEFSDLLIAYAGFPAKKKAKMMKRVKKGFHNGPGIILDDFLNFYQVLYSINDIDTALTFYNIAGAPIQRSTMKHVAHTVAGVELSDHIIDVVFVLFDEDGDGKLSNKEFIQVMKQRAVRGLEKPKDTGIGKFMNAISKCAHDVKPAVLGGTKN